MLNSQHPMWVGWGPQNTFLYNDAYLHVLGSAKHPWALGRPAAEVWSEIWDVCGPLADKVFQKGEATFVDEVQLFMRRSPDFLEETFYSFSYSPIRDESGAVGGLFCPSADVSAKVIGARRLSTLSDLATNALIEKTAQAACASAAAILAKNFEDIPFALLFLASADGRRATLEQCTRLEVESSLAPAAILLDGGRSASPWLVAEVMRSHRAEVISQQDLHLPFRGPADQVIREAMVLPLISRGEERPVGVLVVGVSPTRRLDSDYQTFFTLIAGQIAAAIANARASEEERRRAEALAELDRAKTTFFSNVSHELRTPLTLMLGPLEDLLNHASHQLAADSRTLASVAHRNGLRLLKLVNNLLDFSRIEAGRVQAHFEPTNLANLTSELAGVFQSAADKAGLAIMVDCPALPESVYVDREMWEKIVLNLLSNAFKFTFEGSIHVVLRWQGETVQLSVKDSGVGIPAAELPRIFERFHRVRETRSRTHEGTGIGLALVQELARLHGGAVEVQSREGVGTTFTVSIRTGQAHLPADRISESARSDYFSTGGAAFIGEASAWLREQEQSFAAANDSRESFLKEAPPIGPGAARILLADDNADMRSYVTRLLSQSYQVTAVSDGQAALEAIGREKPDLVLTDVMMPRLDGFELLARLRSEPATRTLPVIMLSARAGEDARVDGWDAGADDYLTKPFSARELLARVASQLAMSKLRSESEERITRILESIADGFLAVDRDWHFTYMNSAAQTMLSTQGVNPELLLGKHLWKEAFPQAKGTATEGHLSRAMRVRSSVEFEDFYGPGQRWYRVRAYPVREGGLSIFSQDITDRKRTEDALRRRTEQFETLLNNAPLGIYLVDSDFCIREVNPVARPVFAEIPDLIGRKFDEVIHRLWPSGFANELIARFRHTLESGEAYSNPETSEERLDLRITEFYEWRIDRITLPDGRFGVVCYFRDISAEVKARQALKDAKDAAEMASRAKDRFLAQLSHELRTPLAPVLMTAAALYEDERLPVDARDQLGMIKHNIALEARLIDDLLDLTRIVHGKLTLRAELCDVHSLIAIVMEIVREDAREKGVQINLDLSAQDTALAADPARLQQVFWNLLRNAVKFTPAGGRIDVRTWNPGNVGNRRTLKIEVRDNGIGFDAASAGRIFEPFEQGSHGLQSFGGLGLGLAIARAVVDLHGGTISAKSEGAGTGATFEVELPGAKAPKGLSPAPSWSKSGETPVRPSPLRILVVEDHDSTRAVLTRLLERAGHHISAARDVAEARALADALPLDLVISDLGLPDGTGIELMKHLSARYHLPGIALSGFGMDEDLSRSREAGFLAHLVKPVDFDELRRTIVKLVAASKEPDGQEWTAERQHSLGSPS